MNKIVMIILLLIFSSHVNADEQDLTEVLQELNNEMPMVIDSNTTITEIKIKDGIITYFAELRGFDFENMDIEGVSKAQKISNIFSGCQNEDMSMFFELGYVVEYLYSTPTNEYFSTRIAPKDCEKINADDKLELADLFVDLNNDVVPIRLDSETELVSVRRSKNSVELVYEVTNYTKDELDLVLFEEFVKENSVAKNCVAPDTKLLIMEGISLIDTYIDKRGVSVFSYETDMSRCLDLLRTQINNSQQN
jgi:hypothetical protein